VPTKGASVAMDRSADKNRNKSITLPLPQRTSVTQGATVFEAAPPFWLEYFTVIVPEPFTRY